MNGMAWLKKELFELAAMPSNFSGEPLIGCDMVTQEHLVQIQDRLADILEKLDTAETQRRFPFLYRTK